MKTEGGSTFLGDRVSHVDRQGCTFLVVCVSRGDRRIVYICWLQGEPWKQWECLHILVIR